MGKITKLNEYDINRLVRKVLNEQSTDNKLNFITLPYMLKLNNPTTKQFVKEVKIIRLRKIDKGVVLGTSDGEKLLLSCNSPLIISDRNTKTKDTILSSFVNDEIHNKYKSTFCNVKPTTTTKKSTPANNSIDIMQVPFVLTLSDPNTKQTKGTVTVVKSSKKEDAVVMTTSQNGKQLIVSCRHPNVIGHKGTHILGGGRYSNYFVNDKFYADFKAKYCQG